MFSRRMFIAAAIYAAAVATAAIAEASDVRYAGLRGGIKDNAIETILVPEAVEIPDTVSWYLRADFGLGISSNMDVETATAGVEETDAKDSYSFGFGRYLSPNLRADITFDWRNDTKIFSRSGVQTDRFFRPGTVSIADPINPGSRIDVTDTIEHEIDTRGTEVITFQHHTLMANLYYDFTRFGSFRPYLGGGVGVSMYQLESTRQARFDDCRQFASSAVDPITNPRGQLLDCDVTQEDIDAANEDRSTSATGYGLAANVMVGSTIELDETWKFDLNYRFTYHHGSVWTPVGAVGDSIDVGARTDHEVRFGVRYDIW